MILPLSSSRIKLRSKSLITLVQSVFLTMRRFEYKQDQVFFGPAYGLSKRAYTEIFYRPETDLQSSKIKLAPLFKAF